jgi:RHS repeat-associated protein
MEITATYIKENGTEHLYYTATDHLGSICQIIEPNGTVVEETNYDPCSMNFVFVENTKTNTLNELIPTFCREGRPRNTTNWTYTNAQALNTTYRGYTGHEMLPEFGLINMNGRIYDPALGRMLSPDNYVQDPYNPQNYNRYAYVLNNPLKYTDPTGNMGVLDSWINGFVEVFFSTGTNRWSTAWKEANNRAYNDLKIWGGLFIYDNHYSGKGNSWRDAWQIVSIFTWELPQTTLVFFTAQTYNTLGLKGWVKDVDYYGGATVLKTGEKGWGGVTLGSFIIGANNIEAEPNNLLFQHEYGHYLQSQGMGINYLSVIGIPSIRSERGNYKEQYGSHDYHPVEIDANRRAFKYFNENEKNYKGWYYYDNSLISWYDKKNGQNPVIQYSSFTYNKLKPNWVDYYVWLIPLAPFSRGFDNASFYNN